MFQYPYGDSQQLNLDWLMEQWQETKASIDGSLQGEIDRVEAAITDLLTARDQAVAAKTAAETAATSAAGYAGTASAAASTATAQATAAASSAALAGTHASNAQTSETNAGLQATAAGNSASAAAVSEGNARNSELAAAASSSAAAGNALYAEGFAVGEQNGTPVSSGSPYYENNAKYYADQAAQDASDAADSAHDAADSAQDAQDAAALIDIPATAGDIGKAIVVKTVADGRVSEYKFGEAGGGGTPGIIKSIENVPIASLEDGLALPVNKLVVDIDPVQSGSGDPAPDNVRPITGWTRANVKRTGANLLSGTDLAAIFNKSFVTGYSIDTDAKTFTYRYSSARRRLETGIKFKENTQYTFIFTFKTASGNVNNSLRILYTDGTYNEIYLTNANKTAYKRVSTSGKTVLDLELYAVQTASTTIYYDESGIFEGNINTDEFVPYQGTTIPIIFPDAAGTVYGGTITNQGENEWVLTVTDGYIASYNGETLPSTWISDRDVYAPDTSPSTGAEVVYKLANTITYTITETQAITLLNGFDNVWADTGNINLLQYYANSKIYIDNQDAHIKALIAKELPDMTADTALVANDFRIVNNTLYRITAPVASGGTLTPGTNCSATTITNVIKSLL